MAAVSSYLSTNMFLVFFVYGLAFFTMGLVVTLESRRASRLHLAGSLVFLGAFGILNGIVGWMEMPSAVPGLIPSPSTMPLHELQPINCFGCHADPTLPGAGTDGGRVFLAAARLGLMVLSWLGLSQFAVKLLADDGASRRLRLLPLGLLTVWLLSLVPMRLLYPMGPEQWLTNGGILARYILLTPGSLLAGFGLLYRERPRLQAMGLPRLARDCSWAAAFFFITAFAAGLVVPPAPYPPADVLNYASFFAFTGVPVQVLWAFAALAIAFFVVRILRVFNIENDRQLESAIASQLRAQNEALEAQRTAQQAIEAWNRELEERVRQRTHELENRNHELAAMNSIATTISQSLNLDNLLRATLTRVLSLVRASAGAVYLTDPSGGDLVLELEMGTTPWLAEIAARVPIGQGCVGLAAAQARTVCSSQEGLSTMLPGESTCGPTLCVPLMSKGRVLGVMTLVAESEQGLPPQEIDILEAVAGQVGVGIENAKLFDQVQNLAVLEERDRIAREMHDGLAQILGYLNLRIRVAEEMLVHGDNTGLHSELQHAAAVTQEAYADVREAILGLRTSITLEQDLLATLREYLRKFRQNSRIEADLEVRGSAPITLAPAAEVQLIRIIQEALTNVRKHARASRAWVRLQVKDGTAEVSIGDDGRGFDLEQTAAREGHFGLQTMKERAESVGGTLEVQTAPGNGTTVLVRLPLVSEGGRLHGFYTDIVGGRSRSIS